MLVGAVGNARVLTVEEPRKQHLVMIEAVENQSPDYVIVDELSSKDEAQAARTISGRGVSVVATVHGESLAQGLNFTLAYGVPTQATLTVERGPSRFSYDGLELLLEPECAIGPSVLGDYLSYILPEPDFNHSVSLFTDDGDHYEDTVSPGSSLATEIQAAQARLEARADP